MHKHYLGLLIKLGHILNLPNDVFLHNVLHRQQCLKTALLIYRYLLQIPPLLKQHQWLFRIVFLVNLPLLYSYKTWVLWETIPMRYRSRLVIPYCR